MSQMIADIRLSGEDPVAYSTCVRLLRRVLLCVALCGLPGAAAAAVGAPSETSKGRITFDQSLGVLAARDLIEQEGGTVLSLTPEGTLLVEMPEDRLADLDQAFDSISCEILPAIAQPSAIPASESPKRTGCREATAEEQALIDAVVRRAPVAQPNELSKMRSALAGVEGLSPGEDNSASIHFPPIGSQGNQGSCAAWATCYYLSTYVQAKDEGLNASGGDTSVICSPSFMYPLTNNGIDEGSSLEYVLIRLSTIGCCNLSMKEYDVTDFTSWPTEEAWVDALQRRPLEERETFGSSNGCTEADLQAIKLELAGGRIAVTQTTVRQNLKEDYPSDAPGINNGVLFANSGYTTDGHALTIVGYDDGRQYFDGVTTQSGALLIANSWGQDWGVTNLLGAKGYMWVAYSYFKADNDSFGKAWFISDRDNYRPRLYAATGMNHPVRAHIEKYEGGVGDPSSPQWQSGLVLNTSGGRLAVDDSKRVVVDLTDGVSFPPSPGTIDLFVKLDASSFSPSSADLSSAEFFYDPEGDGTFVSILSDDPPVVVAPGGTGYATAQINVPIPQHTLRVQSTPITSVIVSGAQGGVTDYMLQCDADSQVSLMATSPVPSGGLDYQFVRWLLNGGSQPDGQTSLSFHISSDATAIAVYEAENRPPAATGVVAMTQMNSSCQITLTASDPDGDSLTYVVASRPSHGTLTDSLGHTITSTPYPLPNGSKVVTYNPDSDFHGQDAFLFWADDGEDPHSNSAFVNITVTEYDYPPTAFDVDVVAEKNGTKRITLDAVDANPDTLDYYITSLPAHGALSDPGNGHTISSTPHVLISHGAQVDYSPDTDYTGDDGFRYRANDGDAFSNYADVSITVRAGNTPPTAHDGTYVAESGTELPITLHASDPDWWDDLDITVLTKPSHGALVNPIGDVPITTVPYTIPDLRRVVKYTSVPGYTGSDSFTFKANDGINDSNVATVTIEVGPAGVREIWPTEVVDPSSVSSYAISMARSPAGNPAISYVDKPAGPYILRYAEYNPATDTWSTANADNTKVVENDYTSLAFAPNGEPAIAYQSDRPDEAWYARRTASGWSRMAVDSQDDTGFGVSLRFDPVTGRPWVAHSYRRDEPRLAKYNGSTWDPEVVDDTDGSDVNCDDRICLEIDTTGRPRVCYDAKVDAGDGIRYARKDSGSWARQFIYSEQYQYYPATADLGSNHIGLVHYDGYRAPDGYYGVRYMEGVGGTWGGSTRLFQTAGNYAQKGGYSVSLCPLTVAGYAQSGQPGVVACMKEEVAPAGVFELRYAYRIGSTWHHKTIAWDTQVTHVGLAYDAEGYPHVAYRGTDSRLTVARPWTTVSTGVSPSGSGSVLRSPDKTRYFGSEPVMLTANANPGWLFSHWTGDVPAGMESDSPLPLVTGSRKLLTANFTQVYFLTTSVNPAGGGTVTLMPDRSAYSPGEQVQLQARPAAGATFVNWTGDVPSGHETDNPLTATMDRNRDIVAQFDIDEEAPTVIVEQAPAQADPTNVLPIRFSVIFSEEVHDFDETDVAFGGAAPVTVFDVSGTGASYTISVSAVGSDGAIAPRVPAGGATDVAGNLNLASTSADNSITVDRTRPTVTVNQASDQTDPTSVTAILFDVVFSESITGFDASDVAMGGSASGVTWYVSEIDGERYRIVVTALAGDGTIAPLIAAAAATDDAGNANLASTSTDGSVFFDGTPPRVESIIRTDSDPTSASSVGFQVRFSEAVNEVDRNDFSLSSDGLRGASIDTVNSVGVTCDVNVHAGTGLGGLRLDVIDDNTIHDSLGNALGGPSVGDGDFANGQEYLIASMYYLAVESPWGVPRGSGYYTHGTDACWSVDSPVYISSTERWVADFASGCLLMDEDTTVTVAWTHEHYLVVDSIHGDPQGAGWYGDGTEAGWSVTSPWSSDACGRLVTDPTSGVALMDRPTTVAVPWTEQYYLTIDSPLGNPQGTGWYDGGTTACWSVDSPAYASPVKRWVALEASGCVALDACTTVPVAWTHEHYLLTRIVPEHGGAVTPEPGWFAEFDRVTLEAAPTTGYLFLEWRDDVAGTQSAVLLIVNAPSTATAAVGLLGDVDGDDQVTTGDLARIREWILGFPIQGARLRYERLGDVNLDGVVDVGDLISLEVRASPLPASVEPSGLLGTRAMKAWNRGNGASP